MAKSRVYISSPISKGDLKDNINKAVDCFHLLMKHGMAPLCPQLTVWADTADYDENKVLTAKAHALPQIGRAHV